jgi:phospholipid-binding lipoprotein MlaA
MTDIDVVGGVSGVVDGRAELIPTTDSLERTSLDYYAALRSLMAQRRAALVEEGRKGEVSRHSAAPSANPSIPDED